MFSVIKWVTVLEIHSILLSSVFWNKELIKVHKNPANNIADWFVLGKHKWLVLWQFVLVIFVTLDDEDPSRNISERQNIICSKWSEPSFPEII